MGIKKATTAAEVVTKPDGVTTHGVWTLVATHVASSDATIDVIDLSTDFVYKFFWSNIRPATDNVTFWIRTSTNNGASFDAGGSDYAWAQHWNEFQATSPAHAVGGDNLDSKVQLWGSQGSNAGQFEAADVEVTFFNPSGTEYTKLKWEGQEITIDFDHFLSVGAGVRLSAADVNAVQFLYSSGNISVGTLKVYAIRV